ncbi:hypothetical protein H1R20_g9694, partial [Candolleomyces eurysporus]
MRNALTLVLGGLALALAVKGVVSRRKRNPRRLPLPPGPKGLPLLGNLRQLPKARPWEGYHELCKEYGDILYLEVMGQRMLILGSRRRAVDLFEKRAANYSNRPSGLLIEMMNLDWMFVFMQYGLEWRRQRRAFHQYVNSHAVGQYHPVMYEERNILLRRLKTHPDDFLKHLHSFLATVLMRMAYGLGEKHNVALIREAETSFTAFATARTPGKYLVNTFPILRHIPAWFPGAGFRRHFQEAHGKSDHPSMASTFIEHLLPPETDPNRPELETDARKVCAQSYFAGAQSMVNLGSGLILALANNPEVQRKARAEIDSVVGSDRLPTVTDRENLPYVHAVVKEINRWHSVTPLGAPRASVEDDEYDGYFIPKGTMIFPNNWYASSADFGAGLRAQIPHFRAVMHDPEVFDRPFEFIPERYLKDGKIDRSVPDSEYAAFGHGRR